MIKQRISKNYTDISSLMTNIGYEQTVQSFLTESDSLSIYELSKKIESLMGVLKNTNRDILDIVLISEAGKYTSLAGNIQYAIETKEDIGSDGEVHYSGFRKATPANNRDMVLFGMNVFYTGNKQIYGTKIGYIMVALDASSIQTELQNYPQLKGTSIYMLDPDGIVYTNADPYTQLDDSQLERLRGIGNHSSIETLAGKRSSIQSFNLPEIDGAIIIAVPISSLTQKLEQLKKASYILLVVTFLVIAIPYITVMMNILKPLAKLISFMKRVKGGDLNVLHAKVSLEGYAEIEVISHEFNTMLERINHLTDNLVQTKTQLYQAELEKQRAEFSYLQSQINPHFLSNTLDAIKGISLVRGVKEIYEMTNSLSRIMRYSMQGAIEVRLEEELNVVKAFVNIHQGRFPGKISFEQYCPPDILSATIPKMSIQPLVENALSHGLEASSKKGRIILNAYVNSEENLEIVVTDNGVGIEPDRLSQLTQMLNTNEVSLNKHIGIRNVHNRLWLKHGKPYGVKIHSVAGLGTEVILTLPLPSSSNPRHNE
ncbi:histidine kinase [Paenibacillus oryzisoli]|uniref:sensor histidine kinase n=1 Tax=Paenibacillus oryzisoli TaxID=1850517 RepID=UPI003D2A3998